MNIETTNQQECIDLGYVFNKRIRKEIFEIVRSIIKYKLVLELLMSWKTFCAVHCRVLIVLLQRTLIDWIKGHFWINTKCAIC